MLTSIATITIIFIISAVLLKLCFKAWFHGLKIIEWLSLLLCIIAVFVGMYILSNIQIKHNEKEVFRHETEKEVGESKRDWRKS